MSTSQFVTSATLKRMLMRAGEERGSERNSNGSTLRRESQSAVISSKANSSIRARLKPRNRRFLVIVGSGLRVRTRRIPASAQPKAPWANTTASSCVINMYCAAAPVPPRNRTSAPAIATSSLPRRAGSFQAFAWLKISPVNQSQAAYMAANPVPRPPAIAANVLRGLMRTPKSLPPFLFYDDAGSALFEEITRLHEYYLTRTERSIFRRYGAEVVREVPTAEPLTMIELGADSALFIYWLSDHRDLRSFPTRRSSDPGPQRH